MFKGYLRDLDWKNLSQLPRKVLEKWGMGWLNKLVKDWGSKWTKIELKRGENELRKSGLAALESCYKSSFHSFLEGDLRQKKKGYNCYEF